ncbi:MAG: succinate dehydrogenase, hydrophobic membrane anchor protein [Gammaproteobacteria bacterium]|nr:succinate dehydrogenase, hydrophobic membrane anchor protein [Gammaproteobacteria bacterium]
MSRRASGFRAWVFQRITAVYLGLYFLFLAWYVLFSAPTSYVEWREWVANPVINLSLLFFAFSLLLHAWVGTRDIIIDYIKPLMIRVTMLVFLAIGLMGSGLWTAKYLFLTITSV